MSGRGQGARGAALVALGAALPLGEGAALAALAALAACHLARRRAPDAAHPPAWLGGAAVLRGLALWLAAGLVAAPLAGLGFLRPAELGRWAPLLLLPVVLRAAGALPRPQLRRAAWAFCVSLTAAAVFGLLQYGLDVRPGEAWVRPDAGLAGQALVPGGRGAVAGGFYFHRLKLAHVLLVGICGLAARQALVPLPAGRRLREVVALTPCLLALLLTFARGALVGLGAGLTVVGLGAAWRRRGGGGRGGVGTAAALACLALAAALALSPVRARLRSAAAPQAAQVRAFVWGAAVQMLVDHPLGVGLGNYPSLVGAYYDALDPDFLPRTYPHSLVLATWAETGPLGLLGFVGAWAAFVATCVRRLRGAPGPAAAALAGLAGSAALWTVGLTHDVFFHGAVALTWAALWAWSLAASAPAAAPPAAAVVGRRAAAAA